MDECEASLYFFDNIFIFFFLIFLFVYILYKSLYEFVTIVTQEFNVECCFVMFDMMKYIYFVLYI